MPNIEDVTTWTDGYLAQQIQELLGEGKRLDCTPGEVAYEVRVLVLPQPESEEDPPLDPEVIWSDTALTERDALFKAYHRFWRPGKTDGVWSLRNDRPSLKAVAQKLSEKYADPEDVDPEEVASVYAQTTNPERK